ncbi:Polyprotein [Caligus rogercresseyi]|uniref:Polyprotein n=1 Tax=Caligus rogercresseyi TaxID=217165 RepID=A0A7T8QXA6_CALRO|nr:Polyprotein [Caligus rogercresseyi]
MSITGAMRSTPTATMEILCGLMPLHLYVMERACMMRLRTRKENPLKWFDHLRRGHLQYLDRYIRRNDIPTPPPRVPFWSGTVRYAVQKTWCIKEFDLVGYTDGSRINNQTGAGWALTKGDTVLDQGTLKLDETNTVFQAEVEAIKNLLFIFMEIN